ncbi:hypothetical protein [Saccharopolyspora sp. NPDC002578]
MAGFSLRRIGELITNPTHEEFRTEEEQVARAVDRFGRMVALGDPADRMPRPGAERSYSSDESWQQEVLAALGRADLVLLTAGPGDNLAWEVDQVLHRNDPTRLVILISHRRHQYEEFADTLGSRFPAGLPRLPKSKIRNWIFRGRFVHAAIWFDAAWNPHLEMLDGRFPLIGSLRRTQRAIPRALRELYLGNGLTVRRTRPVPPPRPWSVRISVMIFTALWITAITVPIAFFTLIPTLLGASTAETSLVSVVFSLALVLSPIACLLAVWTYRVWRGGPLAIVTMQTANLALVFSLVTSLVSVANSNLLALLLFSIPALPLLLLLSLPALLLLRHDARKWIQACA